MPDFDSLIKRDPRPVHDQIIDHDLVGKSTREMVALLVIEMRRFREEIAQLGEDVRRRTRE